MQKKHLHLQLTVLLLLLFWGCGEKPKNPENPYLSGVKALNADLTVANEARLQWGDVKVRLDKPSSEVGISLSCDFPDDLRAAVWTIKQRGTGDGSQDSLRFRRGFRSLAVTGTDSEPVFDFCLLPDNDGFSIHHTESGESAGTLNLVLDHMSIRDPGSDYDGPGITPKWVEVERGIWIWPDERYRNPCIGINPPVLDLTNLPDSEGYIHLPSLEGKSVQVVLARSDNHDDAIRFVRDYLGKKAGEVEALVLEKVKDRFALQINTENDNANTAIALLQSSLLGANQYIPYVNPDDAVVMSDVAAGLFLNSRNQPLITRIMEGGSDPLGISEDELIFSSANGIRAVTSYGILQDEKLSDFTSKIMAALTRLDAEYTADERVILDSSIEDTLMNKAVSYVRFADLMTLGQEISSIRGQSIPTGVYRRKALDAAKLAQKAFTASYRDYRDARLIQKSHRRAADKQEQESETADPLLLPDEENQINSSYPDTTAFLQAGARFGFNYISRDPTELIANSSYWSAFFWQQWVRYRFQTSSALHTTSDSDSLFTVLLEGPSPGWLTNGDQPDLAASSQALRNIAEIYLGVQPDWADNKLKINPRMPNSWGRTAARLPLGAGFLYVEYDFLNETATVRIENIQQELDVLFYYPLPSEKTLRTQFKLAENRPEVTLFIIRDRGDRMNLEIE